MDRPFFHCLAKAGLNASLLRPSLSGRKKGRGRKKKVGIGIENFPSLTFFLDFFVCAVLHNFFKVNFSGVRANADVKAALARWESDPIRTLIRFAPRPKPAAFVVSKVFQFLSHVPLFPPIRSVPGSFGLVFVPISNFRNCMTSFPFPV